MAILFMKINALRQKKVAMTNELNKSSTTLHNDTDNNFISHFDI